MAKNKHFKNTYLVTVEGKTTNGFVAQLVDGILHSLIQGIGVGYQQVKTTIKVVDSVGDFDAEERKIKEAQ